MSGRPAEARGPQAQEDERQFLQLPCFALTHALSFSGAARKSKKEKAKRKNGMRNFLILLAVVLSVMATGCGQSSSGGGEFSPGGREDTLARIKREGALKWGADPSGGAPFAFFDPKDPDKVIGFEVDIMDKLAAHIGVKPEMVRCSWDALLEALLAKRSDIVMNGIEINAERQKRVAFSKPYYVYEQMLTVRAADKDKFKSLEDLKGKKIGTLSGAEANNVLKRAGFAPELLCSYEDSSTPYKDLELGRVEAVLQEQMIAEYYAGGNPKVFNVPQTFSPGKYGVALRKEDASLLAEMDRVLDLMKKNGELADIYRKWKIWNERQKEVGVQ
jgi:polar amino acid transport system substrate-binding protein